MTNIKAIIFDMDGVLIDSRELISRAIEDVLAAESITVSKELIAQVNGKPVQEMYKAFAPNHDPKVLEQAHLAHHDNNMHLLKGYEGTHDALKALKKNYKLGIFTGFSELSYDRLSRLDLLGYFEAIVDNTKYTKHKPDPEGLLLCLKELGVSPHEAIYVGDAISDMAAGHAAGVRAVVGVTHGFGRREDLEAHGADYMIDSLLELAEIIEELGNE